jgi:hypothetical protein
VEIMKLFALALAALGVFGGSYALGRRIPADAVALALGMLLGALASVPISLVIQALFARRPEPAQATEPSPAQPAVAPPYPRLDEYSPQRADYPPLVIINPTSFEQGRQRAYAAAAAQSLMIPSAPRQFRIVGEEAT